MVHTTADMAVSSALPLAPSSEEPRAACLTAAPAGLTEGRTQAASLPGILLFDGGGNVRYLAIRRSLPPGRRARRSVLPAFPALPQFLAVCVRVCEGSNPVALPPPDDHPPPADLPSQLLHGFVRPAVTELANHALPAACALAPTLSVRLRSSGQERQDRQGEQPCG